MSAPVSGLPKDNFAVRWTVTRDFGSGGPFSLAASGLDGIRVGARSPHRKRRACHPGGTEVGHHRRRTSDTPAVVLATAPEGLAALLHTLKAGEPWGGLYFGRRYIRYIRSRGESQ